MIYHLLDYWYGSPEGPYAYKDALFRGTCAILLGFVVVWILGPRVIRELIRRKIGDHAEFDHAALNAITKDKKNVPTMGGILIIAAILLLRAASGGPAQLLHPHVDVLHALAGGAGRDG